MVGLGSRRGFVDLAPRLIEQAVHFRIMKIAHLADLQGGEVFAVELSGLHGVEQRQRERRAARQRVERGAAIRGIELVEAFQQGICSGRISGAGEQRDHRGAEGSVIQQARKDGRGFGVIAALEKIESELTLCLRLRGVGEDAAHLDQHAAVAKQGGELVHRAGQTRI